MAYNPDDRFTNPYDSNPYYPPSQSPNRLRQPPPPPPGPIAGPPRVGTNSPFADPIPRPTSGYYPPENRQSGAYPPPGFAPEYDYSIPNPHGAAPPLPIPTPRPPTASPSPYGQQYALSDTGYLPPPRDQHVQFEDNAPLLPGPPGGRHSPPSLPGTYPPSQQPSNDQDGDEGNLIRYGRIPQRIPRRYKTVKKFELFHGNYVYDAPVPSKILNFVSPKYKTDREFNTMRYTGATCDPNDFKDKGFTLRQVLYDPPRRTELFIVMTMYNEDETLFLRTMQGVMKNIAHLVTRSRSKTWGDDGWKKVVVCIVSDGRAKINGRTLSVIAAMGCYQDGVAKNVVNGKPVEAHLYEYTTQVCITPSLKLEGAERGTIPVQVLFCLKEKNAKKINSHRWFFNAFGPILQPNVCVLLDVGTQPGPTSIYHLWKAFDINSNVGGACGEIVALKGKYGLNLLNPLVAAQNFEYKMSNILDKPLESVFGYITVLPGAFSAYRYIALQNDNTGEGPLQKYFLGEKMHGTDADIFTSNMYLAEDRILCWELVSKRGGSWILHYVKSAYAVTDVPDQVPELISQRRRWLNGSFFAAIHSVVKFNYLYRSSHSFGRKFWIHVELFYQVFNLFFSWFALGNYYVAFVILSHSVEDPTLLPQVHIPNIIMQYVYLGLLVMCFLLSLGNRPQGSKWPYTVAMIGFGFITVYMTFAAFYLAVKGAQVLAKEQKNGTLTFSDVFTEPKFGQIVLSILATLGLYIFASILFFDPWHMITSFLQYLLLAPSYINVLNVYAFSNVHDISWGTKGDNTIATDLGTVQSTKTGDANTIEAIVPTDEKDIDAAYDDALHVLNTKPPKMEQKVDDKTQKEDYYKGVRTHVLLSWTLSNGLLAAAVTSSVERHPKAAAGYIAFILYSVAFLAFFRFVGCSTYLVIRLFAGE